MHLNEQATQPTDLEYRTIKLTRGQSTVVDAADFEELSKYKWQASWSPTSKKFYATRSEYIGNYKRKHIRMNRQVMGFPPGIVDHADRNTLNNRRSNLRVATTSQNQFNSKVRSTNKCGIKGIYFITKEKRWCAEIKVNGKTRRLGRYRTSDEAAASYRTAILAVAGEFANGYVLPPKEPKS